MVSFCPTQASPLNSARRLKMGGWSSEETRASGGSLKLPQLVAMDFLLSVARCFFLHSEAVTGYSSSILPCDVDGEGDDDGDAGSCRMSASKPARSS